MILDMGDLISGVSTPGLHQEPGSVITHVSLQHNFGIDSLARSPRLVLELAGSPNY
jgi:hypothetical protein